MSFSLPQILLFIVAYLTGLFAVAHLADRGTIPERITHHPAVYVLSLGVFAGAMATYGTVELAHRYGYSFLLYYLGVVLMFVMATVMLLPLLRLCRVYQLGSLADVLTFRFRSPRVGAAITVAMCITLLPLLALQIQAVADSIHILAGDATDLRSGADRRDGLALLFCIIIIVFSVLFGTRNVSSRRRNTGLVTAIAFESLVKLAALLVLFFAAIYNVFDGFGGLDQWLAENPPVNNLLDKPVRGDTARGLLLIFFAGAVCMPHIFHMTFAENTDSRDLHAAAWGFAALPDVAEPAHSSGCLGRHQTGTHTPAGIHWPCYWPGTGLYNRQCSGICRRPVCCKRYHHRDNAGSGQYVRQASGIAHVGAANRSRTEPLCPVEVVATIPHYRTDSRRLCLLRRHQRQGEPHPAGAGGFHWNTAVPTGCYSHPVLAQRE